MGQCIVYLQMNNKTTSKILAVLTAMIAMSSLIGSVSTVSAHTPNFMPYGEVGQEDQAYYWHDGVLYINAVPSVGNGLFIAETDIDQDYSIDQAIDRFHIDEDTTHFNVQPSLYSETELVYQLDKDLQFQLIGVVQ
jgi:hypothetical protein